MRGKWLAFWNPHIPWFPTIIVYSPKRKHAHNYYDTVEAIGITSLTYDSRGNETHILMWELDRRCDLVDVLIQSSRILAPYRIRMIFRTRKGYHFITDMPIPRRNEYVKTHYKLVKAGIADRGQFLAVRKRARYNIPFLSVLRFIGKYRENDIKCVMKDIDGISGGVGKWLRTVYHFYTGGTE